MQTRARARNCPGLCGRLRLHGEAQQRRRLRRLGLLCRGAARRRRRVLARGLRCVPFMFCSERRRMQRQNRRGVEGTARLHAARRLPLHVGVGCPCIKYPSRSPTQTQCPYGSWVSGLAIRSEASQGAFGDDSAVNGLRVACTDPAGATTATDQTLGNNNVRGDWCARWPARPPARRLARPPTRLPDACEAAPSRLAGRRRGDGGAPFGMRVAVRRRAASGSPPFLHLCLIAPCTSCARAPAALPLLRCRYGYYNCPKGTWAVSMGQKVC
jgi:hypothetical protein